MFEIRVHGRGGQGVVTAAELLAVAAFDEGRYAQSFPSFGSERTGVPVTAFCRIDNREIRTHQPVLRPDALLVQDPTLLHQVAVFDGLRPDGYLLINSGRSFDELGIGEFVSGFRRERMVVAPAGEYARERLGRPLPNAALLGGFAALTGRVTLAAVVAAIRQRFSGRLTDGNAAAARDTFEFVCGEVKELARVAAD